MSIVKTRAFLEKSGCGWILSIVLGIAFVIGFLWVSMGSRNGNSGREGETVVLFTAGDLSVSAQLWEVITGGAGRSENSIEKLPVTQRAQALAEALMGSLRVAYALEAAKKMGIDVGDRAVDAQIKNEEDQELAMFAAQGSKKQSTADLRNTPEGKNLIQQIEQPFDQMRSVPGGDDFVRGIVAMRLLSSRIGRQFNPSDDEVKHGGDELMLRDIVIHANGAKDADVKKKVDGVLDEIKRDGFIKVADKYAKAAPTSAITADSKPISKTRSALSADPAFDPLKDLKPGDTSKPIASGSDFVLFNLVAVKDNSPKDFDKNKAQYRKQYIDGLTNAAVSKAIAQQQAVTKIEWKDPAFAVLYKYAQAQDTFPSVDGQVAIAKEAAQAVANSAAGGRVASYVRFAAIQNAWMLATPKQQEAIKDDRIEALSGVLDFVEDFQIRMDLADAYIQAKRGKDALEQLGSAAQNISDFDKASEDRFAQIGKRVQTLLAEKLVKQADTAGIEKDHASWLEDKKAADEERAAQAKSGAQQKAENESAEQQFIDAYKKAHGGKAPPASELAGHGSSGLPAGGK